MKPDENLTEQIRNLLRDKLLIEVESPEFDLLEAEMIDSLQFTRLLMELAENFGFNVSMEDIDIDDFRSVNSITRLVMEGAQVGEAR